MTGGAAAGVVATGRGGASAVVPGEAAGATGGEELQPGRARRTAREATGCAFMGLRAINTPRTPPCHRVSSPPQSRNSVPSDRGVASDHGEPFLDGLGNEHAIERV